MELELKLLVAAADLPKVDRHPAVRALRRGTGRKAQLVTVYYDTPRFDLAGRQVALRLRRDGTRWVQTLKAGGGAAAGLHERDELEWDLVGDRLNLGLLEDTPYAELFATRGIGDRLERVFSTEFERTARTLAFPDGTLAELAIDAGAIVAGDRRAALSEVELELKAGDPTRLFALAREIARDVPLRLGHASKAERGYALARGTVAKPRKAKHPELDPDGTAGAGLRRLVLACAAHMQANEDGVLGPGRDPEYVHQFRVGLRRLRSCLGLVAMATTKDAVKPLADEARWLGNALGPARDWDVFLTETLPPLARSFREVQGLGSFRARAARVRAEHREAARAAVGSPRYTAFLLMLGELFARDDLPGLARRPAPPATEDPAAAPAKPRPGPDAPVLDFAAFVLKKRHKAVRRRGDQVPALPPPERHEVRIAAKKARYAAEFFGSLYPQRRIERYAEALSSVQDILGALNDAAVVDKLLAEVRGAAGKPIAPLVEGLIRGWVAAVAEHELERFPAAWSEFADVKRFWKS